MKKEIVIAILVGLIFGLIITYGIYRMRSALTRDSTTITVSASPIPSPSAQTATLTIFNPEDGIIQEQKELTVSGSAIPNSYVVLFVNNEDYISSADQTGNFSFNVILEDGGSILKIHSIDSSGTTTTLERTVIVQPKQAEPSTASAKPSPSSKPVASPRPSPSASTL